MKEQNEEKNLEVSSVITRTEQYIEKNKKLLITIAAAIIVVGLGIWAYVALVAGPRQNRAAEEMFAAQQWFEQGNWEKALNGNSDTLGFAGIIDEYGCTKSGNLAHFYAGICQLNLGKYNEAIDYLKGYSGKDIFTGCEALMLTGDCYAELDNSKEAASYYEKAAKKGADNFIVAPTAWWKAGMMQLKLGDNKKAAECFQQVKDNYPESTEWPDIDTYISYAENK